MASTATTTKSSVSELLPTSVRHAAENSDSPDRRRQAVTTIQKTYRGYRARRQLQGTHLDATARWDDVSNRMVEICSPINIKTARYRQRTKPRPRSQQAQDPHTHAVENWKRITEIARHAGNDDKSLTSNAEGMCDEDLQEHRFKEVEARIEMEEAAKLMERNYFLELADPHHRYNSNLAAYHREWKQSDTRENFFYWLDEGEGKFMDLTTVSRQRLDSERVRYLSREERQHYLTRIDAEGRLCWAKNGERISTNVTFKDSLEGIVPSTSKTKSWSSHAISGPSQRPSSSQSATSTLTTQSGEISEPERYVNHDLEQTKGLKKITHISPTTILNQLLRNTVKPGTWIFVADTSFRLYVGIKDSGSFQHSSFLSGARIASAGLIKIKDGQLRKLSPLSGHYRPPTKNFKMFVHSLRDAGVDMTRVSISRSYAVLVGLEAYMHTRKSIKHGVEHIGHQKDRVLHPEEYKKYLEDQLDKSKSAQREREVLEQEQKKLAAEKSKMTLTERLKYTVQKQQVEHSHSTPLQEVEKRSETDKSSSSQHLHRVQDRPNNDQQYSSDRKEKLQPEDNEKVTTLVLGKEKVEESTISATRKDKVQKEST